MKKINLLIIFGVLIILIVGCTSMSPQGMISDVKVELLSNSIDIIPGNVGTLKVVSTNLGNKENIELGLDIDAMLNSDWEAASWVDVQNRIGLEKSNSKITEEITINVPKNAKAGKYRLLLEVSCKKNCNGAMILPFTLNVK